MTARRSIRTLTSILVPPTEPGRTIFARGMAQLLFSQSRGSGPLDLDHARRSSAALMRPLILVCPFSVDPIGEIRRGHATGRVSMACGSLSEHLSSIIDPPGICSARPPRCHARFLIRHPQAQWEDPRNEVGSWLRPTASVPLVAHSARRLQPPPLRAWVGYGSVLPALPTSRTGMQRAWQIFHLGLAILVVNPWECTPRRYVPSSLGLTRT